MPCIQTLFNIFGDSREHVFFDMVILEVGFNILNSALLCHNIGPLFAKFPFNVNYKVVVFEIKNGNIMNYGNPMWRSKIINRLVARG
jgi:hypothetical protein